MTWCIAFDSSCNLRDYAPVSQSTLIALAPLKVNVGGVEFVDDENLDTDSLLDAMVAESEASSSACPSVGEWSEVFRSADNVIAVTISSNLSGSYDAACTARNIILDDYIREHKGQITGKNIFILDSRAAGGKLEVIIKMIDRYLSEGHSFNDVVAYAQGLEEHSQVLYSLSSYDNLTKNGRMPKLVGTVASKLNIRMLGTASAEGTIKIVGPTRGEKKTYRKITDTMEADGFNGGMVYIDHVRNPEGAQSLADAILARWETADVQIIPCGGLCSYYAEESGLIIGYEWL